MSKCKGPRRRDDDELPLPSAQLINAPRTIHSNVTPTNRYQRTTYSLSKLTISHIFHENNRLIGSLGERACCSDDLAVAGQESGSGFVLEMEEAIRSAP